MNKHGFTLIEVVTVIFIVGMLFLIAIPPITKSVKDTTNELYDKQLLNIKVATSNWVSDNIDKIPETGDLTITLGDLKNGGYVDEEIANPKTGKEFDNEMKITIKTGNGKDLIYEIDKETIEDVENQDGVNSASLVLNGEQIEYVELGSTYTETKNVKVIDSSGNDITSSTTINVVYKDSDTTVSSIDTMILNQYQVIYSATVNGTTVSASKNVIIRDTTSPTIVVAGNTSNYSANVALGSNYTIPSESDVVITDNSCSSTCDIEPNITGSVNTNVAGTYQVTYSATDSSGNVAKIILTVKVGSDPFFTFETPSTTSVKNGNEFTYILNLSEQEYSDIKITKDDFTINKTGSANATITEVNQNGYQYEIVLLAGTGEGTISITPKAEIVRSIIGRTNEAGPSSATVIIDNTVPSINFSPTPQGTCNSSDYTVTVSATDNNEGATLLTCKTTGNNGSCTPTTAGTLSGTAISINTDNNYHLICAQAIDKAGNIINKCSNESGKYYSLDKTGPTMSTSINPTTANGSDGWYKTLPTVSINNSTSGCAVYTGYKYQISTDDGSTYESQSNLQTNDTALNNEIASNECKPIKYKVTGYDSNNNSKTYESSTIKYDKTAPTLTVDGHTSDYSVQFVSDDLKVGEEVYFNPVTGQACNDYVEANSLNENNTGCMRWYVLNNGDDGTVDLLLDHNTTKSIAWDTNAGATGPVDVMTELNNDTSGWLGVADRTDSYTDYNQNYTFDYTGYKARLIEGEEIANLENYSDWDSTYSANNFGISTNTWLTDYMSSCSTYGCHAEDSTVTGYWTVTAPEDYIGGRNPGAWGVTNGGVYADDVTGSDNGVRPVITVNADILTTYTVPTATATDNCGEEIEVVVSGNINPEVSGDYQLTYTATDLAGNETSITVNVNIKIVIYARHLEYSNPTYTTCTESQCAIDELFELLK